MRFRKLTAGAMAAFLAVAMIVTAQDYQGGGSFQPDRDMLLAGIVNMTGETWVPRATSPAQTVDASVVWDSDSDLLTVGTGTTRKTMTDTNSTQTLTNKTLTSPSVTNLTATGFIKSSATGATGGLGYLIGAGCAVTQVTNRSTGVACAGLTGAITTDTTSLAALAQATFTVTNSSVLIGDVVVVTARSGQTATTSVPFVTTVTTGTFNITLFNTAAATADTGAMVINFAIFRGVSS